MGTFAVDLQKWADQTKEKLEDVARQAMVLAAQGVILRSPVDTGRFRANWALGIGAADLGTTAAVDPTGAATIGSITAQISGPLAAPVLYLTNSLPYAARLEYEGWSKQAPDGMVRVTIAALPAAIDRYIASLR